MKFKKIAMLSIIVFAAAAIYSQAWAKEDREKITSIPIYVKSSIEAGESNGSVDAFTDSDTFTVDGTEILNEDDIWKGGDRPRIKIYLSAGSDYYFYSDNKSLFTFSGEDCTFVSASRKDSGSTMELTIKLEKLDNGDLTISGVEWDPSTGVASWEENTAARYYQVRLLRSGTAKSSIRTSYDTSYDLSSYVGSRGYYSVEVRGVGTSSEKGSWTESEEYYLSSEDADNFNSGSSSSPGDYDNEPGGGPGTTWNGTSTSSGQIPSATGNGPSSSGGYWCIDTNGWWFRNTDGSYTRNNWQLINGQWYFFNTQGYMQTGWISWNNRWYCCAPNGAMYVNCKTPDGYYVGGDGAWLQ